MLGSKRQVFLISFILIIVIGLAFSYGFLSYHYKLPPYNFIMQNNFIRQINYTIITPITSEEPDQYTGNILKSIKIENEDDIIKKRNSLIKYIWKSENLPKKYPSVIKNISDEHYSNLKNLKQIDKLVVDMEYNFSSISYYFHSSKPNNELIIYHQGHGSEFIKEYDIVQKFLNNGYDVIVISMPLVGKNNQPEIELEGFGKVKFTSHKYFIFLDNETFSSIKLFIEPSILTVNYAQKLGYEKIYMIGFSGGGWTTVLVSAIDPRISKSYHIAGSYPIYIRFLDAKSWGDYEQMELGLYRIANYLELYILGSYGDNRKQVQILNLYDSCCFSGRYYLSYENILYKKIELLGKGNFTIFVDDTHSQHELSKTVLNFIIDDLK